MDSARRLGRNCDGWIDSASEIESVARLVRSRVADACVANQIAIRGSRFRFADDRLSRAASAVIAATFPNVDWEIAAHGDCTSALVRDQRSAHERVLRRFAYATRAHFVGEVEARTTARWTFFNMTAFGLLEREEDR